MSKYLVLYRSEAALTGPGVAEMFANTPPEQMQKGMEMWGKWYGANQAAIIDPGAPVDHPTSVDSSGVAEAKSSVTGYTVVEAESREKAASMMKDHPHLFMPGASIEVLECLSMG